MRKSYILKRIIIFIGGICLCVLIICLIIAIWMESNSYTEKSAAVDEDFCVGDDIEKRTSLEKEQGCIDIWGEEYITEIKFDYGEYATQNDIMHIGQLCHLKSLIISIDDETVDLSPLGNLGELELLSITGNALDLSFMEKLSQLKELRITAGEEVDLSPIGSLTGLKQLSLSSHYAFDLSFLKELNQLEDIYMDRMCTLEDLSYFQDMIYLREMDISYVNDVDLNYLSKCENLESLSIEGGTIRNTEGLANLIHLKSLYLYNINSEQQSIDLYPLSQLTELSRIFMAYVKLEDISPLADLEYLSDITLVETGVDDIAPLKDMESLTRLSIYGNKSEKVSEQAKTYFGYIEQITISDEIPCL